MYTRTTTFTRIFPYRELLWRVELKEGMGIIKKMLLLGFLYLTTHVHDKV